MTTETVREILKGRFESEDDRKYWERKFADIRKGPDAKKMVMRAMKAMKGDVYVKGQEADRETMLAILMQAIEKARQ